MIELEPILQSRPKIVIEGLKNFGDTLHSSVIVRHFKKTHDSVAWIVSDKYYNDLITTAKFLDVQLHPMPHSATQGDRVTWKNYLNNNGIKCISPLCGVSGWNKGHNIVQAVMLNAGLHKLVTPPYPVLKHDKEQEDWFIEFKKQHDLNQYIFLEYTSYTLSQPPHNATWSVESYNKLIPKLKYPVVYTAAASDPKLKHGIDARGINWRQAKVLMKNSHVMVGCGSGLSVMACVEDVRKKLAEINIGESLTAKSCYALDSQSFHTKNIDEMANQLNKYIG